MVIVKSYISVSESEGWSQKVKKRFICISGWYSYLWYILEPHSLIAECLFLTPTFRPDLLLTYYDLLST